MTALYGSTNYGRHTMLMSSFFDISLEKGLLLTNTMVFSIVIILIP